jgi:sulfur-oxidizing protein SoxZ
MASARLKVPKKAKKGDIITIKSLIKHKMETGQRKGKDGKKIPRKIIKNVTATYNGTEVFSADWWPSISANPFLSFKLRAVDSGVIEVKWTDDNDKVVSKSAKIVVS